MTLATKTLFKSLVRLLKGVALALDKWLDEEGQS